MRRSSAAGCTTCAALVRFLEYEERTAGWDLEQQVFVDDTSSRTVQNLMFFTKTARDLGQPAGFWVRKGIPSSGDTGSDRALAQARVWVDTCRSSHATCGKKDNSFVPDRIVEIRHDTVRVVSGRDCAAGSSYVCLSHRWCEATKRVSLTGQTMERYQTAGLEMSALPKMMRDAVSVARHLGMAYIWIDCLCIIQDSPDDWYRQAGMMAAIYENSALTIAATCCSDSEDGLFQTLPPAADEQLFTRLNGEPIYIRKVPPKAPWDTKPGAAHLPLLRRGWVYQERILSHRILHFTDEELMWECMESSRRETSQREHRESWRHAKADVSSLGWAEVVSAYTALDLTFQTDRLPELAGVARAYGLVNNLRNYIAGHWADSMVESLRWDALRPSCGREEKPKVPSWSWAAADGPINAGSMYNLKTSPLTVRGIYMPASSGDPFLDPNPDCKLHLSAPLKPGTLRYGPNLGWRAAADGKMRWWIRFGGQKEEEEEQVDPDYLFHEHGYGHIPTGAQVFCLFYSQLTPPTCWLALVLRKVGSGLDEYERIGSINCRPPFDIHSLPRAKITLA